MKKLNHTLTVTVLCILLASCTPKKLDFDHYPSAIISNHEIQMKVYLPDPDNGLYRATRFDWSGVIGSLTYKDHEYFGYWKDTHDPLYHEDLPGPVEGFIKPGLGYTDAKPGEKFIRIGVGVLEKEDEPEYNWKKTYKILDHGKWEINRGADWLTFKHRINSDFGYGYVYTKTIRLKNNGFTIAHKLQNTGIKTIETDQFNHNFFMIDHKKSGPPFTISFPYNISTKDDLKGLLEISKRSIHFLKELNNNNVFVELSGYTDQVADHQVTIVNPESGAGVTFTVDKPLSRMAFWACETTLCPENFIQISVKQGEEDSWTSDYTLFVD